MGTRRLKLFDNHLDYEDYMDNNEVPTPNVSYCDEEKHVHYDGGDTIITVNLNVTVETQSDFISRFTNYSVCKSVLLDGEPVDFSGPSVITFTVGEHVVEYVFPHTVVCPSFGYSDYPFRTNMVSVIIPEGIKRIESYPCSGNDDPCPSIGDMVGTLSIPSTLEYVGVSAICDTVSISQEDKARLDSCCLEGRAWRASCGK